MRNKIGTAARLVREYGVLHLAIYAISRYKYPFLERILRLFPSRNPIRQPQIVQIEISSKCNLRCPSCSLTREVLPGKNLSREQFRRLLAALPFKPATIALNGIGEPLVNPAFFDIVDDLGAAGISCSFFTNGTLLDSGTRVRLIARRNVAFVGVSCDGASATVFERLRFGANFAAWLDNVTEFVRSARARKPSPIQTTLNTVLGRHNAGEIQEIVRLAARVGFPSVHFADVVTNDATTAQMALAADETELLDRVGAVRLGEQLGVAVQISSLSRKPAPRLNCFQPWEYVQLSVEGDVLPCCAIVGSDRAQVMGNVHTTAFREIWTGARFREFRATAARRRNDLCNHCPYY